jgi:hypothetical protein
MTDSDVLARAAKALREAHTGEREGSGFTRARIMNSLHHDRRRRILRWAIVSPIASVLLVGSAWAQSTGKWPVIWSAVASVFVAAPPVESAAPRRSGERRSGEAKNDPAVDAPAPPEPEPDVPEPDVPEPALPEPSAPVVEPPRAEPSPAAVSPSPRRQRGRAKRRTPPRAAPAIPERAEPSEPTDEPAAASEPERDRELSRFRTAHDLHFKGDRPRDAIEAYAEYLRQYPNGRFVPEARYNGALDQIKIGNDAAAREALEPFASGRFGGYRQKEARELLDALGRKAGADR